ncbi:MAG TPA: PAS domain S-box protein [Spirochaetota bacterium]
MRTDRNTDQKMKPTRSCNAGEPSIPAAESPGEIGEQLVRILEFLPDPTFVIDHTGMIIIWNKAIENLSGRGADSMVGKSGYEHGLAIFGIRRPMLIDLVLAPNIIADQLYSYIDRDGDAIITDVRVTLPSGKIADLWGKASPLYDCEGKIVGAIESIRDITTLKNRERKIRSREEKFREMFENMPLGFFRTNQKGKLMEANPALAEIFGYESDQEMIGLIDTIGSELFVHARDHQTLIDTTRRKRNVIHHTCKMRKKDSSPFTAFISLRFIEQDDNNGYYEGLIEDGTDRIRVEEAMLHSEKMLAIAGLARGMAHEINNPLGIIMQTAENAIRRLFSPNESNLECADRCGCDFEKMQQYLHERKIDHYLDGIRSAGIRASSIVTSMLQFSRGSESRMIPNNVTLLIDKAIKLAEDYFDFRKISITLSCESDLTIMCIDTEIEQALLNILKNSAQAAMSHAFPDHPPEIRIVTKRIDDHAIITIADNGPGMDEKTAARIFEPFFSTKNPGAGLGLPVAYFIITTNHKGNIEVDSEPGVGTTFTISLPLLAEEEHEQR